MADFLDGLTSASDYINNTNINVPTSITGDLGTGTITATTESFNVKELVCALLAGNGLKLPNLQLCLKVNLARLIPALPAALDALKAGLMAASAALDAFMEHTGIDALLARLNSAIGDFAAIANMINFCGTPVIPRPIPNVLSDMMGSFTGAGINALNRLGQIANSDIGGCISTQGGAAFGIFQGGAIKDIGDLIDDIASGAAADFESRIASIRAELEGFASDIENLIEFENNYKTVEPNTTTGSIFTPTTRIHTGVGVAVPDNYTHSQASMHAHALQSTFDQISQYKIDDEGNSVFDFFVEPELLAKLQEEHVPTPLVTQQTPVYDYCGKIIGYTNTTILGSDETSRGQPYSPNTQPGITGLQESGVVLVPPPAVTPSMTRLSPVKEDIPSSPLGRDGDKAGDLASDGEYMYYASADYDGTTSIWSRTPLDNAWAPVNVDDGTTTGGTTGGTTGSTTTTTPASSDRVRELIIASMFS